MDVSRHLDFIKSGGNAGGLRTAARILRIMADRGTTTSDDLRKIALKMEETADEMDDVDLRICDPGHSDWDETVDAIIPLFPTE
jgi:hypothetical protein